MSDSELIDRGKVIAERLRDLHGDAVPGSRNGSRELGTTAVPSSGNRAGTAAVAKLPQFPVPHPYCGNRQPKQKSRSTWTFPL
jgi:hypothetical protein